MVYKIETKYIVYFFLFGTVKKKKVNYKLQLLKFWDVWILYLKISNFRFYL